MAELTTPRYTIRYATEHDIPDILRMIQELASYERALHEVLATEEKLFDTLSFPTSTDEKVRSKPGAAKTLLVVPKGDVSDTSGASNVAHDVAGKLEVETSGNAGPTASTSGNGATFVGGAPASNVAQEVAGQLEVETSDNAGPKPSEAGNTGKEQIAGMALFFNNYSTWLAKPGIYLEDLYVRPAFRKRGYGKALLQALARECVAKDYGRLEWSVLKWNKPSIDFYESETIGAVSNREEWEGMRVTGDSLVKLAESRTS
ncbi:Peroxygenase 1 [Knufia obscura]|uniref:Peroxygenase 1 n=2 Tax=Knufia TaxID=430999 RepID=A0AAN8EMU5_9EURO|nr:Peroxygenase 1 [Knufia obscura]KAK5954923.1 Peroxygenase 1 [Knufia fluminis]